MHKCEQIGRPLSSRIAGALQNSYVANPVDYVT